TSLAQTAPPAEPTDLTSRLEAIRADAKLPALGAALVTVDGLEGVWVTGRRRAGGPRKGGRDRPGDLGPCPKARAATLIALLVARGDLAWDKALGDLLPGVAEHMDPDYLDVTLRELLAHRAGIPNAPTPALRDQLGGFAGLSLIEQRDRITRAMLGA